MKHFHELLIDIPVLNSAFLQGYALISGDDCIFPFFYSKAYIELFVRIVIQILTWNLNSEHKLITSWDGGSQNKLVNGDIYGVERP